MYQAELAKQRYGAITTEIVDAPEFYLPRLSPAIPGEESGRLLRPWRHRRVLPIGTGAKLTQGASA